MSGQAPDDPASVPGDRVRPSTPAPIATRRYGWAVGILAVALVIGFVLYTLSSHKSGAEGVPAGAQLHPFSAPLAVSTLDGDANLNPPCTLAHHDARALNVCLMIKQAPLVLAFFVTNSSPCQRQVDTMQVLAQRRGLRRVQFAAVAVGGSHTATAKAVRTHRWTIPVAYDADGALGGLYGVTACPLLELVERGGTVAGRLIGEHWLNQRALAVQVGALLSR